MRHLILLVALIVAGIAPALSAPEDYASPIWLAPPPAGVTLTHINAAGSLLIKTGKGYISTISINTAATGSLTIYDGINATGAVIAVIDTSKNTANSALSPWPIQTGLFIVLVGNADITIISR
jgi:hypothetical protein